MWFLYALLGAVGKSYSGFFRKKMAGNVSGAMYMWLSYAAIVVVLCPILFINSAEVISMLQQSWLIVLIVSVSSISATILNIEALKREELSYTAPLNAFVPVFTLIIAGLFLGESLHALGVVGIFIIVIGAYVININPGKIARWYTPLVPLLLDLLSIQSLLKY
jgi:drug/metabolite transporter (DMT)-like permease